MSYKLKQRTKNGGKKMSLYEDMVKITTDSLNEKLRKEELQKTINGIIDEMKVIAQANSYYVWHPNERNIQFKDDVISYFKNEGFTVTQCTTRTLLFNGEVKAYPSFTIGWRSGVEKKIEEANMYITKEEILADKYIYAYDYIYDNVHS